MLQTASGLRAAGAIPEATSLWAVANPVTEPDASRTEAKIEAGAQAILTQPPLDWASFERWWADAERRGLPAAAKIMVGFPALSSAGNASFWLALAGAGGSAPARRLVSRFADAEARGRGAAAAFAEELAEEQLGQVGGAGTGGLRGAARGARGRGLRAPGWRGADAAGGGARGSGARAACVVAPPAPAIRGVRGLGWCVAARCARAHLAGA
jgi:hypothetical protein